MTLTFEQTNLLDFFCKIMCNKQKIRFCGIINSMGRMIAGSFKDDFLLLDNYEQRQMLYMQSKLELSMKAEFNENLGNVNYVVTYRDNVMIINIPSDIQKFHILISAERVFNLQEIVNEVANLFKQMEHEIRPADV